MGKRTDKELSLAAWVPERERAGRCKEGEIKTIASMDEWVCKGGTNLKKEESRDYITAAFRYYAAVKAGKAEVKTIPEEEDFDAVQKPLELLARGGRRYIVDAVKAVYFVDCQKPISKHTIALRVRRFAITMPADERTVYRWLREARRICMGIRGLRL